MTVLPEAESYDTGIYQIETTDAVVGGASGKANASSINLANRTKWLKARVDELKGNHTAATGTADAITATFTPAVTTLVDGTTLFVVATAANATTTPTFSPNALTARTIVKGNGQPLRANDISGAGHILELKYKLSGTQWVLQNPDTGNAGLIATNITTLTATGTIPTTALGGSLVINSATATTQTLPAANTVAAGKRFEFINIGDGIATIARAGADTIQTGSSSATTIVLGHGDTLTLESNGATGWYAVGGTAQLKYSQSFKNGSGYFFLPDGTLIQRGVAGYSSAAPTTTFPIAFPTQVDGIFYGVTSVATQTPGTYTNTLSSFRAYVYSEIGNANYIAIGR